MWRLSMLVLLVGLLTLIVIGCNKEITVDEQTAAAYVKAQGYTIMKSNGQIDTYTLEKSKIFGPMESTPYQQAWGVQKVEPDPYFGKAITVYGFTVANHPLEKIYHSNTKVSIILCEGKVIGGTSFPDDNGAMMRAGAPYSIDGKTLEEVTGMTFKEWMANWKKKYGSS
ncbi:hypothetical protein [Paenibacillus sp. FSL H7-0331]|uniref:hypothetical protein n=1 Tax=Paenibacillus sp. FSL H7-0331 TaxID=1920421 RepID=UPI00096DC9E1|nr:hypothetical protein [Paenibacillus sp. FSL H7-0331]OMF13520.1 hypothetical protein BK127_19965 [Paenibacillus sp. FSL H7-0331]